MFTFDADTKKELKSVIGLVLIKMSNRKFDIEVGVDGIISRVEREVEKQLEMREKGVMPSEYIKGGI